MRRYETIFIIRPTITEDEIAGIIEKTTGIIEGDGGSIIKIDKWGLKKLAYLIKKESQGHYVYADFAGIPASVAEIERIFRIDDRVLKYMTLKLADSCDPDAIKEQLAQAEQAAASSVDSVEDSGEGKDKGEDTKQEATASSVDSAEDSDEGKDKEKDTKQEATASSVDSAEDSDEGEAVKEDDAKQETAAPEAEKPVE